jgi:hypothetical protein
MHTVRWAVQAVKAVPAERVTRSAGLADPEGEADLRSESLAAMPSALFGA